MLASLGRIHRKDGRYGVVAGEDRSRDIVKIEVTQKEDRTLAEFAGYKAMLEKGGALDDSVVFYHPNGEVCKRIPRHVMMRLTEQMAS